MYENTLFYGDNFEVLRNPLYFKEEMVDLVYLDPPFNSNATYNVLFDEKNGKQSSAQIKAFEDTWHWDSTAQLAFDNIMDRGDSISLAMKAFRTFLGTNDMLAYLAMMAPRLIELKRVLKPTGTIYLHCDPTASHYLKVLMDAIFGPRNFRNEISWKRHNARSTDGRWPRIHDILLMYTKSDEFNFQAIIVPADQAKMPHTLITGSDGLKYQTYELTAPGATKTGESGKAWKGFKPTAMGRHWANAHVIMQEWNKAGLIHWPPGGGFPRRRDAEPFVPADRTVTVGDIWTDIDRINQTAKERLGYPTQKPEALLERIIEASSKEGDLVLDPFCGCGTAVSVAQRLNRRWIGIDITHLAVSLMKHRLDTAFGRAVKYKVIGEPVDISGAESLAKEDPYQFEFWSLGLVKARPAEQKKGSDKGIDGRKFFRDGQGDKSKQIILSVKAGHTNPSHVRDLRGVIDREDADIGVLITMQEPTPQMKIEAASIGFYHSEFMGRKYPRIQIITVKELLAGKQIEYPSGFDDTLKSAPKAKLKKKQTTAFKF